jgi:transposase-like protein
MQEKLLQELPVDYRLVVKESVTNYIHEATRLMLELLMVAEVADHCGERYQHSSERKSVRWGTQRGTALVAGGKIEVSKPRVRHVDLKNRKGGEIELETYQAMNDKLVFTEQMLARILAGVSTRQYASTLEKNLRSKGVSKSTISRKAIAATKPTVDEFLKRSLKESNLIVLMFDGINLGGRQMIVCIGIDNNGRKRICGLRLGATENDIVCRDLIRDMIERGLNQEQKYLFAIDGSKALVKAIRAAFGQDAAIQRCQEHKIRNVQAYLPLNRRNEFRNKLQAAYNEPTEKAAAKRLDQIRNQLLLTGGEKAANALLEGLPETLTIHRLGVKGLLRKSLRTTNIIESAFSSARRYMSKVTNFKNEGQIDRWAIRSLVETERHFRTLAGNRQLAALQNKLQTYKHPKITFISS